ncbi:MULTISPECIES: hypothetical protein [Paenibacillus]|jgi:hypothetical protein|uniref:hypothetical protein n=1 Tax=Paenibacillus TaxID=44249 RepID=UPI00096F94F6|nr:hypothetical protein [Paenibacillus odorifer]OMD09771.1 hypothetical protein BJP50_29650 [Paenibacillus odorifer]OME54542.1 hypothetical protein BSK59_15310 [Paenibacillus odorifer]
MKKMIIALSVVGIVMGLFIIKSLFLTDSHSEPLERLSRITNPDQSVAKIKRGAITYSLFGSGVGLLKGQQIGIVDGDKLDKIYILQGYSPDEWLIEYYDVLMSNYDLLKADHVTDIPYALEQYRL